MPILRLGFQTVEGQDFKTFAPGEARTHGLQIMRLTRCLLRYGGLIRVMVKNYGADTDLCKKKSKNIYAPGEARAHGLQIMRLTRCLLRYGGF